MSYASKLRAEQAAATSDRILDAVGVLLGDGHELTYGAIAATAGVQERTVYRHFPAKEQLTLMFWQRLHESMQGTRYDESTLDQLLSAMRNTFQGFDEQEKLIRAMLHSKQGLAIRMQTNRARRAMFERVVAQSAPGLDRVRQRRAAAAIQLMYSGAAWEMLRDYWDMDARAAAETSELAIRCIIESVSRRKATSKKKGKSNAVSSIVQRS